MSDTRCNAPRDETPERRAGVALLLAGSIVLAGCGDAGPAKPDASLPELRAASEGFAELGLGELAADPAAMELAADLFAVECGTCHGADGRGRRMVPDLTVASPTYGSMPEAVRETIVNGRSSVMPAMGRRFGEVDVGQLVAYVQSLGEAGELSDYEQRGRELFSEYCAECHGARGRGIEEQGTPSLADESWQHGGSMMNIRLVITRGVESTCPAHGPELSKPAIDLLIAYVLNLFPNAFPPSASDGSRDNGVTVN